MSFTATNLRIVASVGLALVSLTLFGCGSKDGERKAKDGSVTDPRLIGKWELLGGHWKGSTIEFTPGGSLQIGLKGPYSKEPEDKFGRYFINESVVTVGPEAGPWNSYRVEFHSDDEVTLTHVSGSTYRGFEQLVGRWKRTSERQLSGPIADAKKQVQKIEQKLAKLEATHKAALADRDELAAKLRSVGVNSPADLKGSIRGQRLAENVVKLATEIEGLERQLAVIDTELLKAKAIVRRMEREQAALSDDELRNLAVQLREAEERTDGMPLPVTPFDVDAAVEKALKGSTKQTSPKKSK